MSIESLMDLKNFDITKCDKMIINDFTDYDIINTIIYNDTIKHNNNYGIYFSCRKLLYFPYLIEIPKSVDILNNIKINGLNLDLIQKSKLTVYAIGYIPADYVYLSDLKNVFIETPDSVKSMIPIYKIDCNKDGIFEINKLLCKLNTLTTVYIHIECPEFDTQLKYKKMNIVEINGTILSTLVRENFIE